MPTFALAGAGWMAALWGHAIRQIPGHQVTHVASRTRGRAEERAGELGASVIGYDELPAGADLVVVASPPAHHADHALTAVLGGAAVIVETPLTATLLDADRLVAAADGGARIGYAENLLFSPYVRSALHRVRGIGPLSYLEVRALQRRPDRSTRLDEAWGGGALVDLGVHALALALAATAAAGDRPVEVSCRIEGASDHPLDEWAELRLRFRSGLGARLEVSWRAELPVWDVQVATPTSALRLELQPVPHLEQLGVDLPHPPRHYQADPPQLEQFGYLDQVVELTAELTTGQAPYLGARFGRTLVELLCAAAAAARTGRPEPLPYAGPRDRTPLELWRGG